MRNKVLVFLVLVLICPVFAIGQDVTITGKTNIPNALVRLLAYDEMLTREQTKIAETQSDKDGKFTLKAAIKEITPAQIAINLERVDMILNPNGNYDLEILIPKQKDDESYFEREQPLLNINAADDGGLYSQYVMAENMLDDFLYENFQQIYRGRKLYLMDTIENQIYRQLGGVKYDYVKDMIKYRKAAVTMSLNADKTIAEFIDNQKVLYSNRAYMDVFGELFDGYLNRRDFNQTNLEDAFYLGYDSFMTYLEKNDFLSRNRQICELVAMVEMRRMYYGVLYDKQAILRFYKKIQETSKYQKNKIVARNYIKWLTDLSYNSDAPSFSLKDKNGKTTQLSDYQNDMVVLQFVDRLSPLNIHEFSTLNELHKQWGDSVQIVTVVTKESFENCVQMFDKQGYKWTVLNLDDNILLLEDYAVTTFPAYFILKRKNRIGMAPAPSPDQYLDYHVRRISKYF